MSVLASETFDADGPAKRPSVQVGDPFMEKLAHRVHPRACSRPASSPASRTSAVRACPARPPSLASAGDGGMFVHLDKVPLRDSTLSPEEILMSESQERMMAVVEPGDIDAFLAITTKWDVEAAVIGEVTETGRLVIDWHGETVVDVPPRTVAHDGPVYERPFARPEWQDALQADGAEALARPSTGEEPARDPAPPGGQPEPVRQVVDHRPVRPLRAGQHRPRPARRLRHGARRRGDPPRGVHRHRLQRPLRQGSTPTPARRLALAEAYRNVATGGALPAGRERLPQLRLPRGPGRDVAVRRGLPRAQGRLPGAWASRSPAATSASTTRPARRRSCRPRSSRCSA
nr:AIR synthase-related protein [Nocardioides convexus]